MVIVGDLIRISSDKIGSYNSIVAEHVPECLDRAKMVLQKLDVEVIMSVPKYKQTKVLIEEMLQLEQFEWMD